MSDRKLDWRATLGSVVDRKRRDLGPHPDLDEIAGYHRGALAGDAMGRIEDHLVLCPECARLLLDLDAFAEEASRPDLGPAPVRPIAAPRTRPPKPSRSRRRRRWTAVAAAAAALAVLSLWPRAAPLPGYAFRSDGHVVDRRSADDPAPDDVLVAVTGRHLALRLLPATAVADPQPVARAYLLDGGELRTLSASTLEVGPGGVVTLAGVVDETLHLRAGDNELVLVVALPGALPSRSRLRDALAGGREARGKGWAAFRRTVRVEPPAGGPGAPAVDSERQRDLRIEYAGCRTVLAGPVCAVTEDRRLTLWIRTPADAEVRLAAGGRPTADPVPAGDGVRYEIEAAADGELVVEARHDAGRSIWSLALAPPASEPAWFADAREVYGRGDLDAARRLLEPRTAEPDPHTRGRTLGLLARIAGRQGRADEAETLYRRAVDAHRRSGNLLAEVDDLTSLVWELSQQQRFTEAGEVLDGLPVDALGGSSLARYWEAYWRGLIADETGDLRAALRAMDRAARHAERAGKVREEVLAADMLARQLHTLGAVDSAADLRERIRERMPALCGRGRARSPPVLKPCDCVRLRNNQAWAALLDLEAGRGGDDPTGLLRETEALLVENPEVCGDIEDLPNLRLNLALAALHAGDLERARRLLDRTDTRKFPRLELWRLDLEARIALEDSQPGRALDLYRELGRRAEVGESPEAAWRAAFGRALALERLGRPGDALAACAGAEDLLDHESLRVPMHAGRELFLAQREPAARLCLDLALREERETEALAIARRSARRALRHLHRDAGLPGEAAALREEIERLTAEIAGGLPRDREARLERRRERLRGELREWLDEDLASGATPDGSGPATRAPGTVLLLYHPLPEGWAGFAADALGVTAGRIDLEGVLTAGTPDVAALSDRLLGPFREPIRRAAVIEVIPYGALRDVDFHTLSFDGDALLRHAPVVYRLDLPPAAPAPLAGSPKALVVSGPGLRASPAEAGAVRDVLAGGGWEVELLGGREATAQAVRQRWSDVDLFHYAGHAEFDDASRGWDSRLALARGTALTVGDVLAEGRVPRRVVLAGCETGRDSRHSPLPSIGLAQAFLVAGAESVVAATAEVSDAAAADLMAALYRHWDPARTLAAALREAQLEVGGALPEDSDVWKFRVLAR